MVENEIIKEAAPSFDLGIENSQIMGNLQDADTFLSGESVTAKSEDIEKATEADLKPIKKTVKKVEIEKTPEKEEKIDPEEAVNKFLTGEEEEEEEAEVEVKPEDKASKEEDSTFKTLSESLYEAGVFTTEEDEEPVFAETPEEFLELFNKEKSKGVSNVLENFLSKHGEDRRELFEAIFVNGVDPAKYLPVYNEVIDFEKLDMEDEANQERTLRTYYTRAGWEKAKVDSKIERLKNYAELEEEAKTVHPLLVKEDKQKLVKMEEDSAQVEADKIEADKEYKTAISKILQEKVKTKDFDGLPLDEKIAEKAFHFLYTKKWKLPSGELLTDFDKAVLESKNSDNVANRIKMALLYMNNFDLSKVQKKAITKESNQLFNKLVKKEPTKNKAANVVNNEGW